MPEKKNFDGDECWFSIWKTRRWMLYEVGPDDTLYWVVSGAGENEVRWKTTIRKTLAFSYSGRGKLLETLRELKDWKDEDEEQEYLEEVPGKGFCFVWWVKKPKKKLSKVPTTDFEMPQWGWKKKGRIRLAKKRS